ncbi:MAG: hypothetical protein CHACPFDD_03530 [Phycisphaerae bacterium]|nr:hypothetical protein [Phycisphaerae bacterium]
MKSKVTCIGLTLFLSGLSIAQDPPRVRFFFDTNGAGEQQDRGVGDLLFQNPAVDQSGRLYLYGHFLSSGISTWTTISLDIEVTGGGRISAWNIYNHTVTSGARWAGVLNKSGSTPTMRIEDVEMRAVGHYGMALANAETLDFKHFRDHQDVPPMSFGNTLLGYVDVDWNGSPYSEIRLGVGDLGIVQQEVGGIPQGVAFGFGDEGAGIKGDSFGMQSPVADATITPEPATLLLLVMGAGATVRARQRRPTPRPTPSTGRR